MMAYYLVINEENDAAEQLLSFIGWCLDQTSASVADLGYTSVPVSMTLLIKSNLDIPPQSKPIPSTQ